MYEILRKPLPEGVKRAEIMAYFIENENYTRPAALAEANRLLVNKNAQARDTTSPEIAARIDKRYAELRGMQIDGLKAIYKRSHRVTTNLQGVSKQEFISDILRDEFGDKRVDEWM